VIRILLVDDHEIVLRTWKTLLENNPEFKVIGVCQTGAEAISLAESLKPDILIVDIKMDPMNGFEVTSAIHKRDSHIRIIGLSLNNLPSYAKKVMALGARGFLTKTSTLKEINEAIKIIHEGGTYICEEVQKKETTNHPKP